MQNLTTISNFEAHIICNVLKIADVEIHNVSAETKAFFKSERLAEYRDVTANQEHIYNIAFILDSINNPEEGDLTKPMTQPVFDELNKFRGLLDQAECTYLRIV